MAQRRQRPPCLGLVLRHCGYDLAMTSHPRTPAWYLLDLQQELIDADWEDDLPLEGDPPRMEAKLINGRRFTAVPDVERMRMRILGPGGGTPAEPRLDSVENQLRVIGWLFSLPPKLPMAPSYFER